jgi:hypothetical protein
MKPETLLAAFAVIVAVAAMVYTAYIARENRDAALVSIGISILRSDPQKEGQVNAAREWALNLIDANAGGVKFSAAARNELLTKGLGYVRNPYDIILTPEVLPPNPK